MTALDDLGKKHKRLLRELEELKPQLHEAIRAERAAGVTLQGIQERSGYKTIQQIRTILAKGEEA